MRIDKMISVRKLSVLKIGIPEIGSLLANSLIQYYSSTQFHSILANKPYKYRPGYYIPGLSKRFWGKSQTFSSD